MPTNANPAAARGGVLAPFAALVAGAVAMGASPIFVRLADVGPFTSAFWRVALALPLLYAWMRLAEERDAPGGRFTKPPILSGLAFAGDLFFWHLAIVHTSVANATFFATCAPIWVVLFGWLLFRERVKANVLIGLALCLAGGAALLAQSFQLKPAGAIGDVFGVATGIFFGLYFLAVQAARKTISAARLTFEATVVTAAVSSSWRAAPSGRYCRIRCAASRRSSPWPGSATPAARASSRSRSAACPPPSPRSSSSSRRSRRRASAG